jgi:glycosyltransferase involved in cell wall biosynthesis
MRISAILTVYNTERYVSEALDSMLAQTSPPDEIIVVDDGSTDGTSGALSGYATQIKLIRQQNHGPAHALNVAIAASCGEVLAFLDADDVWLPQKLQLQRAALGADEELEAIFSAIRQFVSPDLDSETTRGYVVPTDAQPGIGKSTMLIRRQAFDRVGSFDQQHTASDFFGWYARANALKLRVQVLPDVLAMRRHHPGNLGRRERSHRDAELLHILKATLDIKRGKPRSEGER